VALVWAVPVVAAAVAAVLVAAAARPVGDEVTALVDDVRALRRLRAPLTAVRGATADSAALGDSFRHRHPPDDSAESGGPGSDGDPAGGGET
jgi:hypothetical protein